MQLMCGKVLPARVTVPRALQPTVRARPMGTYKQGRRMCAVARGTRDYVMFSFDKTKTKAETIGSKHSHKDVGCPDSETGTCSNTIDASIDEHAGFTLRRDHDPTGCPESETGMCDRSMDEEK